MIHSDQLCVRSSITDLQSLAYDVEDVLDEFNYEVMRRKLVVDAYTATTYKVRNLFIPTCCSTNFSPAQAKLNVNMGQKIKVITHRLEEISGQEAILAWKS